MVLAERLELSTLSLGNSCAVQLRHASFVMAAFVAIRAPNIALADLLSHGFKRAVRAYHAAYVSVLFTPYVIKFKYDRIILWAVYARMGG